MTQYLLSVWHDGTYELDFESADAQRMFAQVDAVNAEMQASGTWVFGGGLHPAETATVVKPAGDDVVTTDGPFAETKEQIGGFWVIEAADLDAALGVGAEGGEGVRGPGRGAPVPGRAAGLTARRRGVGGRDRARVPPGVRPVRRHPDPRLRRPRPRRGGGAGGVPRGHRERGRPPDCLPTPAAWIMTTARNRAIDRLRREATRGDRQAQAAMLASTDGDPPEPVGPVRDDRLRLIFTCCHPALAPAAQVALTLRLLGGLQTPRDRPRLPRPRADDGPAHRARQGQDPRRQHPLPGPRRRRAARPPAAGARVIYLVFNEGYTRHRAATTSSAATCATRRSGWPGCWPS